MKFEEALKAMREGEKVRRKSKPQNEFSMFDDSVDIYITIKNMKPIKLIGCRLKKF